MTILDNAAGKFALFVPGLGPPPTYNCSGTFLAPGLSAHHHAAHSIRDLSLSSLYSRLQTILSISTRRNCALSFIHHMIQLTPVYLYYYNYFSSSLFDLYTRISCHHFLITVDRYFKPFLYFSKIFFIMKRQLLPIFFILHQFR